VDNEVGGNEIGELTTSGQLTTFTDPSFGTADWNSLDHRFVGGITAGSDGNLWFSNYYASNEGPASIESISTSGVVGSEYQVHYTGVIPTTLAPGPDGALWFTGYGAIGRMTTSGQFSEYTAPNDVGQVLGITAGPDGALWLTNYTVPGDSEVQGFPPVVRVTTTGVITTYGNPLREVGAMSITAGSDGAMWFVDHINDSIGRVAVP
jgi:virginiamycin B lyase